MNRNSLGTLYIVATPIGNLQDMSLRAIDTLKSVAWIAAEDTRHSAALLKHYSITTKTVPLHEHNERERTDRLLESLQRGESIALISDAGTPLISDPGYHMVHEARTQGVRVVPIPGACAAIAALSASGLPTDRFIFEGFLPAKSVAKTQRLAALAEESRTLIFYESPHRIVETMQAMQDVLGSQRIVVIARELTKLFETIHSGTIAETLSWMTNDTDQQRGEFVVLVAGADAVSQQKTAESERILTLLLEELPLKQAVDLTVKITQSRRNDVYAFALSLKK